MRLALRTVFIFLAVAAMCATPGALFGQAVNGSIVGTITDASGGSVPNAQVTITEGSTNISRTTRSNESGNYVFSDVTPGVYSVAAEVQGFKKEIRQNVSLQVNTTMRVDLQLQPGQVQETVNVTAEAPALETDRADTGRTIEARQVVNLPISANNHNFQQLLNLVPGTTQAFRPHSQFFNPQDSLSTQVNGNSRLANNLQLEGIDDNERTGLLQVYIPPMEAIQTVDVTTSNYDAELGRAGGAVTNVVLKSGTNNFHGAVYAFNKTKMLQARSFFNRGPNGTPFHIPATVYNYDGFDLGGPIQKNKIFIFGDFLHISDHRGQSDNFTLPTADFRGGDFSKASTTIYDPATGNSAACLSSDPAVNTNCGAGRTQFVASSNPAAPNFNPACGSAAGCPNMIPVNRFDPVALKILGLIPLPNSINPANPFGQNFIESSRFIKTTTSFDIKVDQNPNDRNHISYRFSYIKPTTLDPPAFGQAGGPHGGGFQGTGTQKTYVPGVNWDHIFSASLISEFRFGVERYRNDARQSDYGKNDSTAIGIPGANTEAFTSGLTSTEIGGGYSNPLVGYSASMPWIRAETNILVANNWTKTLSNHTIKWGVDYRRLRDDLLQTQTVNPRGLFSFGTGQTSIAGAKTSIANDFASFLLGVPSFVGRDLPIVFPAYRASQLFFFGQDKWQFSPKLTLDLGLRWEYYPPATPHFSGGFSNYDPVNNNLVVAGVGSNPLNLGMQSRYKNFAPRLGIAYRLTDKTVIRSGFGISYEPFPDNTYAYNFPVKQNNVFNNVSSRGPALLPDGTASTYSKGFPAPLVAQIPSNGIIPANTPLLINQDYDIISRNFKNPYVESWNFAIQRALPHNFTFEAAYVGNHAVDVATTFNLNAVQNPALVGIGSAGRPQFNLCAPLPGGLQTCRTAASTLRFVGTSANYHALQVKFDHRSGNFLLTTAYTYSKSLDITDEDGGYTWYINPNRSYGRAGFDRTHTFVQSYIYQLPFGKGQHWVTSGTAGKILGGWQVTGILTLLSGTPLFFTASGNDLNTPGNSQTANINGPFTKLFGIDTKPWFDKSVFSQPVGKGVFGNLGRNVYAGPGFFNLDAALFRRVQLTERFGLEVRAEGFSVTNTPHFDNPNQSFTSSNFGLIKGAGGARSVDFGVKLDF